MLNDKVALVTGSSRGIGLATARLLARHGATVILNGRNQRNLDMLAASIAAEFSVSVSGIAADVTDAAAVKDLFRRIFDLHGRLNVLVNNAGVLATGVLGMLTAEAVRSHFETNVVAQILCLQEASRLMARSRGGTIINISSVVGLEGASGMAVYAAAKAAIVGLTKAAAKELAGRNVRVNAVAPGFIETDLIAGFSPKQREEILSRVPLRRMGTADDVAGAVSFLASDYSSYVTGQVLAVAGGIVV